MARGAKRFVSLSNWNNRRAHLQVRLNDIHPGDGAHLSLLEYIQDEYPDWTQKEIMKAALTALASELQSGTFSEEASIPTKVLEFIQEAHAMQLKTLSLLQGLQALGSIDANATQAMQEMTADFQARAKSAGIGLTQGASQFGGAFVFADDDEDDD